MDYMSNSREHSAQLKKNIGFQAYQLGIQIFFI